MNRKVSALMKLVLAQSLNAQEMKEFMAALSEAQERINQLGSAIGKEVAKKYGDGCLEVKTIRGHQYLYRRYLQGGKLRSQYLGKAGAVSTEEKVKALKLMLPKEKIKPPEV